MAIALDLLIAFVERAAANMGDFRLSYADAPIVAEICRKLDGLPVAIEFPIARVAPFSVRRLAAHLYERLRLLMSGRPTPPYRAFRDGPSDSRPLYCDPRFWVQGLFGQSAEAVRNILPDAQAGRNSVSIGLLDR